MTAVSSLYRLVLLLLLLVLPRKSFHSAPQARASITRSAELMRLQAEARAPASRARFQELSNVRASTAALERAKAELEVR